MKRLIRPELKQPQTLTIVLSQCVDTSVGLVLALLYACLIALFVTGQAHTNGSRSLLLFTSGLALVWALNFFHRLFFVSFLGATLGQYIMGVRACVAVNDRRFWIGQAIESLHLVFPLLWIFEICGRLWGSRYRGLRYMVVSTSHNYEF